MKGTLTQGVALGCYVLPFQGKTPMSTLQAKLLHPYIQQKN